MLATGCCIHCTATHRLPRLENLQTPAASATFIFAPTEANCFSAHLKAQGKAAPAHDLVGDLSYTKLIEF